MSLNELILKEIVKKIRLAVSDHLLLVLTTDHLNSSHDVDLFIILNNSPPDDPYNMRAYFKLVEVLKQTVSEIEKKYNVHIVDFSTFRIEEYHVNLFESFFNQKVRRLHLMIYPTLRQFLLWENPSIILSICTYYSLLYGDESIINKIKENIEPSPLEERIQPLISLLFETYRNIKIKKTVSSQVYKVLLAEGIKKLEYCLKFTIWEILREILGNIPPTKLDDIVQLAKKNRIDEKLINLLQKVKHMKTVVFSMSDLIVLYEKAMFVIEDTICKLLEKQKGEKK